MHIFYCAAPAVSVLCEVQTGSSGGDSSSVQPRQLSDCTQRTLVSTFTVQLQTIFNISPDEVITRRLKLQRNKQTVITAALNQSRRPGSNGFAVTADVKVPLAELDNCTRSITLSP